MPTGLVKDSVWSLVSVGATSEVYFGATWSNSQTVTLVGSDFFDGIIVTSHDRGLTWMKNKFPSNPFSDVDSFVSESGVYFHVAVSARGNIAVSSDNARSWNISLIDYTMSFFCVTIGRNGNSHLVRKTLKRFNISIYFYVGQSYAAGIAGRIFTSDNTSNFVNWNEISPAQYSFQINGISTYDGIQVFAVGEMGSVITTNDQGSSWSELFLNTTQTLYCISQCSNLDMVILGDLPYAIVSNDGGINWNYWMVFNSSTISSFRPPHNVDMLSPAVIFAGSSNNGEIAMSRTRGNVWITINTQASLAGNVIYSLDLYSTDVGVAGKRTTLVFS